MNIVCGILQGWTRPTVAMLAAECSAVIHRWIAEPLPKSAHEMTPDDLCDTNLAMLEAWETLTGTPYKDILTNYQPNLDVMNAAWELAKLFNFRLRFEEGMNSDGDMVPAFGINIEDGFLVNARTSFCGRFEVPPETYGLTQAAVDALEQLNKDRGVL